MKQQRVADSFAYPPRLMELERAAAYVGLGRTKFSEMVKTGHMPKPVDLDGPSAMGSQRSRPHGG
jgi:predicted DNA-binding transcriptional regulator AlpA